MGRDGGAIRAASGSTAALDDGAPYEREGGAISAARGSDAPLLLLLALVGIDIGMDVVMGGMGPVGGGPCVGSLSALSWARKGKERENHRKIVSICKNKLALTSPGKTHLPVALSKYALLDSPRFADASWASGYSQPMIPLRTLPTSPG